MNAWILPLLFSQQPLSLSAAIDAALSSNETPQIARARVEQAEARRREVLGALFPTLGLTGTYTRRQFEVRRDFGGQSALIQSKNALAADAAFEATLLDAAVIPRYRQADAEATAQGLDAQETARLLAFSVADGFLAVQAAQERRIAAERRVELADRVNQSVQARVASGLLAAGAAQRQALELATAKLELTRANNAVRLLRLDLGFLVGAPIEGPLAPIQIVTPVATDFEAQAQQERLDLKVAEAQVSAAEHGADEPWMRMIPSIVARGTVRASNEPGILGQSITWNLAVSASWILYDGGVRYAQARGRAAVLQQAHLSAQRLARTIRLEVQKSQAAVENALAALAEAELRQTVAARNHEDVRTRFDQGLASALDEADAALQEFQAATVLVETRLELDRARLELLRSLGDWPVPRA